MVIITSRRLEMLETHGRLVSSYTDKTATGEGRRTSDFLVPDKRQFQVRNLNHRNLGTLFTT